MYKHRNDRLSEWDKIRIRNKKNFYSKFKELGIRYRKYNSGLHWVTFNLTVVVDVWPTTGKWNIRECARGEGLDNLISKLRELQMIC